MPLDGRTQTLDEARRGTKAELALGWRHVGASPRLAVGLRRIPGDVARKARQLRDQLDELANADLSPRPEIHRLRFVVTLQGEHDRARTIFHVEKLAAGRTRTPDFDPTCPGVDRVDALLDQRGNHVRLARIERIAWTVEIDRQEIDAVETVLLPIRLRLYQEHLLRKSVGCV